MNFFNRKPRQELSLPPIEPTPNIPELRITATMARRIIQDRQAAIQAEARKKLPQYVPRINALISEAANKGEENLCINIETCCSWIPDQHWEAVLNYYKSQGFTTVNHYDFVHINWGKS